MSDPRPPHPGAQHVWNALQAIIKLEELVYELDDSELASELLQQARRSMDNAMREMNPRYAKIASDLDRALNMEGDDESEVDTKDLHELKNKKQ